MLKKLFLSALSLQLVVPALAQQGSPNLTDVARDADGEVSHMNQYDADNYCRSKGQRLPTARELALYAESLGAKGISEIPQDEYVFVDGFDSSGNLDPFYFNNNGYKPPATDYGFFGYAFYTLKADDGSYYDVALWSGDGSFTEFDIQFVNYIPFTATMCVQSP